MSADYRECADCGKSRAAHNFARRNDRLGTVCIDCRRLAYQGKGPKAPRQAEPDTSIYWLGVPTDRLLAIVAEWKLQSPHQNYSETHPALARRVTDMHRKEYMTFDYADRLLIEIGMEHEWHESLADLYEVAEVPLTAYSPAKRRAKALASAEVRRLRRNELAAQNPPVLASRRAHTGGGSLSAQAAPAPSSPRRGRTSTSQRKVAA